MIAAVSRLHHLSALRVILPSGVSRRPQLATLGLASIVEPQLLVSSLQRCKQLTHLTLNRANVGDLHLRAIVVCMPLLSSLHLVNMEWLGSGFLLLNSRICMSIRDIDEQTACLLPSCQQIIN